MNSSSIGLIASLLLSIGTFAAVAPNMEKAEVGTAEAQPMTPAEVETTRLIRERLTNEHDLSVRAHNIKIITEHGRVYLKGPVASIEEKAAVARLARQAANGEKVVNETYVEK